MNDSLQTLNNFGAGVPSFGMRVVILFIGLFITGIGIILLYFKMKERDDSEIKNFK